MAIYAIHDYDPELKKRGAFEILKSEIDKYNLPLGYGIFFTPNNFNGRRKAENCTKINFWYADIDNGDKYNEQLPRIMGLPLKPSVLVETRKGFHCYWKAEDATLNNFKVIEKGLIQALNADKACTDVCRLLRYPGTYHIKDPTEPFKIKIVHQDDKTFSEAKMLCAFRLPEPKLRTVKFDGEKKDFLDEANWERIFKISQIGEGNRNSMLSRYCFWLKDLNMGNQEINYIINGLNSKLAGPLPQNEIDSLLSAKGVY